MSDQKSDQKLFCRVPTCTHLSQYQISLMQTRALRSKCAPVFLPLFDHLVSLAADSYALYLRYEQSVWARRAGRELAAARKTAGYSELAALPCHEQGAAACR